MATMRLSFVTVPWLSTRTLVRRTRWLCSTASPRGRGRWDIEEADRMSKFHGRDEHKRGQQWQSRRDPQGNDEDKFSRSRSRQRPPQGSGRDDRRDRRPAAPTSFNSRSNNRDRGKFSRERTDVRIDNRRIDHYNEPEDNESNYREESGDDYRSKFRSRDRYRSFGDIERNRSDRGEPTTVQRAIASGDDLVYGVSPVLAALRAGRRDFFALFLQERGGSRTEAERVLAKAGPLRKLANTQADDEIRTLAKVLGIPLIVVNKGQLNVLAQNRPHQGFVLQTSQMEYEDMSVLEIPKLFANSLPDANVKDQVGSSSEGQESLPKESNATGRFPPVWLVLDEVSDPQNFGALLRSAYYLGAEGVIACRRNSSALTPVVSKASAGALEWMRVKGVSSMPRFLNSSRERGWRIIGASTADEAISVCELAKHTRSPTLLVLGSEGRGLRPVVQAACNSLVRIDGVDRQNGSGDTSADVVDSLNVSVAGAIALHELLRQ